MTARHVRRFCPQASLSHTKASVKENILDIVHRLAVIRKEAGFPSNFVTLHRNKVATAVLVLAGCQSV